MTKEQVIKKLIKNGFGLPDAIKVYKELSAGGVYEIDRKELTEYIKENGYG
jgi:hypothetical protein